MKISVVIPVRNEERSIAALLDALLSQSLPPDEIVITDGGSTDRTAAIIQEYINRGAPVKLIRTTKALPGRGRNLGAARAVNEWLAFTDAGIKPAKNWLEELAARATAAPDIDVVYGSYEPAIDSFFKECAAISYVSPPAEIEGSLMRPPFIASALLRREAWESVGGFPEHLRSAEDLLFMQHVEQSHFKIAHAPAAVVHWDLQPNIWRTFKRFTLYSRNNMRAGLWRQWQGPVLSRYLLLVLLTLAALFFGPRWLSIPLGLWLLMLLARALVSIWRNRRCYPTTFGRNCLRVVVLMPVIAVLDFGSIVGSIQWFLTDKLYLPAMR